MKRALAVAALCGLALVVLLVFEPPALSDHALARKLGEPRECEGPPVNATMPARGVRVAVRGGVPVAYDAARDATLLATRYCSHRLVPPGVWVEGDHRADDAGGPRLLRPVGDALTVEASTAQAPYGGGALGSAVGTFRVASPWPPFLAYAALVAALLAAVSWAFAPRAFALAPVAAALLAAQLRGGWVLLASMLSLLLAPVALAALALVAVALARRRRPHPAALATLLALAGFFLTAWLAFRYFPPGGAGD